MELQCGMLIDRGKPDVLGEKHVPEYFVHHKFRMIHTGIESWPEREKAFD
jgi:hypothetical protein